VEAHRSGVRSASRPADGHRVLVQSVDDPRSFVSFGAWPTPEAISTMRRTVDALAAIGRMQEVCEEARPGTFRVVATAPAADA
jgi:hypothetical protein